MMFKPMQRSGRRVATLAALALTSAASSAMAFDDWRIVEVYTHQAGTVQYVELRTLEDHQQNLAGQTLLAVTDDGGNPPVTFTHTFVFPNDSPAPTSNHRLLLATPAYLNQAGHVTPDYIIPSQFLFTNNCTLIFASGADSFFYESLPNNGVDALYRDGTIALNTPMNFAGEIGQIGQADCNANLIPDTAEVAAGTALDCNADIVPDDCQIAGNDCNENLIPDDCDAAFLITSHPPNDGICPGATAMLSIQRSDPGSPMLWHKDGVPLSNGPKYSGVATETLSVSNFGAADEGVYSCHVQDLNSCLVAKSRNGELSLLDPVGVAQHPVPQLERCAGEDASFIVTASGSEPYSYEWRLDGAPLGAPNLRALVLPNVTGDDAGEYTCAISNECGTEESTIGVLDVQGEDFAESPGDECVDTGETVAFHAEATSQNGVDVFWAWKRNGTYIGNNPPHVTGADTDTLTITNVTPADAADYVPVIITLDPELCINNGPPAELRVDNCAADIEPPVLTAAVSVKNHAAAGEFAVDVFAGESDSTAGGISQLVITFDEPVEAFDGSLDTADVSISDVIASIDSVSISNDELTIELTSVSDAQCLTVEFGGISDASGNVVTESLNVLVVYADIDDDGAANAADVVAAKGLSSPDLIASTAQARGDLNLDGIDGVGDITATRAMSSPDVTVCP